MKIASTMESTQITFCSASIMQVFTTSGVWAQQSCCMYTCIYSCFVSRSSISQENKLYIHVAVVHSRAQCMPVVNLNSCTELAMMPLRVHCLS